MIAEGRWNMMKKWLKGDYKTICLRIWKMSCILEGYRPGAKFLLNRTSCSFEVSDIFSSDELALGNAYKSCSS